VELETKIGGSSLKENIMKVVINKCFGGFSLSPKAVRRLAELKGRKCFFFDGWRKPYTPISDEEAEKCFAATAFDVANPNEIDDSEYREHSLYFCDIDRTDADLIKVVEELGAGHRTGASGSCADLRIVEIPNKVGYEIEEYDGNEHIAETHRTWG
jgi:hypothetical protein